jgi:hypothetical protein
MDNERDEIKDIVAQLKRLQIQETELFQRLEQLSEADRNPSRSPDTTRGFGHKEPKAPSSQERNNHKDWRCNRSNYSSGKERLQDSPSIIQHISY